MIIGIAILLAAAALAYARRCARRIVEIDAMLRERARILPGDI
jgi:hypothetical protein